MPKGSPAAIAHLEQVRAYYLDPSKAPHKNPPGPPSPEVACELAAAGSQIMAIFLDRIKTGEVHENPCTEAVLAAAELADKAFDGDVQYNDVCDVLRRFGWKGD